MKDERASKCAPYDTVSDEAELFCRAKAARLGRQNGGTRLLVPIDAGLSPGNHMIGARVPTKLERWLPVALACLLRRLGRVLHKQHRIDDSTTFPLAPASACISTSTANPYVPANPGDVFLTSASFSLPSSIRIAPGRDLVFLMPSRFMYSFAP